MNTASDVIAAVQGGDAEKLRALLAGNPSLAAARDANGVSAIMHAAYRRRADMLDMLADANPNLDIFEATATGRAERVSALLRGDRSLATSFSADGFTALHFASFFGQGKIAGLLLDRGADPGVAARNAMKVKPLHSAASARNLAAAQALLEHGANPNECQEKGWTPIHSAAQNGDKSMIELLLHYGADPTLSNDDGVTAMQLAAKGGFAEVVQVLEKQKH